MLSFEQQVLGRLVPAGALRSCLESSAVESGEGQMENVGLTWMHADRRPGMRWIVTRGALKRLGVAGIVLVIAVAGGWWSMIRMPGQSWKGPLPQLTESQAALRQELQRYVEVLAGDIGEHNLFRASRLTAAEQFIEAALAGAGYTVQRHPFEVQGVTCVNLSVEIRGAERPREIVIVGGHYDTAYDCPGANDNGSGVAATLAYAVGHGLRALVGS